MSIPSQKADTIRNKRKTIVKGIKPSEIDSPKEEKVERKKDAKKK